MFSSIMYNAIETKELDCPDHFKAFSHTPKGNVFGFRMNLQIYFKPIEERHQESTNCSGCGNATAVQYNLGLLVIKL